MTALNWPSRRTFRAMSGGAADMRNGWENAGMSKSDVDAAARLFDDFITLEWQDLFRKEVHVKLDNGARYVPNGGSQGVQLLRKNVNAFHEAIRLWSGAS